MEVQSTTDLSPSKTLFLYSLSDESIQLQLEEEKLMRMMKGRESITLNVHGTLMVTVESHWNYWLLNVWLVIKQMIHFV